MGIVYWRAEAEHPYVIHSMQGIALEKRVWEAYLASESRGRDIFKQCAVDSYDWQLSTVVAYANYEDNPPPPSVQPTAPTSTATAVVVPARGQNENTKASAFYDWMLVVKAATDADRALSYQCGKRWTMNDGTVAVPVALKRGTAWLKGVSFVFHYHPGSKGAVVGGTAGSKWHFKPFDFAKKWVRMDDSQFGNLDAAMVKEVKRIARGR